jgi:hypothetical protein
MKRTWILLGLLLVVTVAFLACASPQEKAQKMMNAGQYEQVIALYQNDPNMAAVVQQAKDKIAEKLFNDGKYSSVLELYPTSPVAQMAKNKMAEALLAEKKYQEILDKYPDTPAAAIAKLELEKAALEQAAGDKKDSGKDSGKSAKKAADADAELTRIMNIKIKDLRIKALKEFVANPLYAGTAAEKKARAALPK